MKTTANIIFMLLGLCLAGCTSMKAYNDLNTTPENLLRGDPLNKIRAREFLQGVLDSPEGYEVKAYHRRPYSTETKKTVFKIHYFYVYYKDDTMLHTLVFTGTPKGSEHKGSWMLDADTDVESYNLYIKADNPWQVEEYQNAKGQTKLDKIKTTQNIIKRLDRDFRFFGASIARDLAWYHQIWMFLAPPPVLTYAPLLLLSIHKDSCATAVIETAAWEK